MQVSPITLPPLTPPNGNPGIVPPWMRDDFFILPVPNDEDEAVLPVIDGETPPQQ